MKFTLLLGIGASIFLVVACSNNDATRLDDTPASITSIQQIKEPTFDAPSGWSKTNDNNSIIFTPPEGNATLALVNLSSATNAITAAQLAFTKIEPNFSRKVKLVTEEAPQNGWDTISEIEFQTSPAEERLIYAYPHEYKGQWSVILLNGHLGTIAKRGAAARGMLGSLTRFGFTSEDLSGRTAATMGPDKVKALLDFVKTSARGLSVPGVGVGIIQNGKLVYSGGVGVKNIDSGAPIDGDTRFMIASNTKGMTTLLLAKLVEMGRLNWSDTVVKHYPKFRLGDDQTTESVQIKHLVCACTGLPRKDFEWVFNNTPDTPVTTIFDDLAATEPTSDFGELYQYNNQMAAAAGYIAGHLFYPEMEIGAAYDRAMQEYIFDPLGMNNTTLDFSLAIKGNVASPYGVDYDGTVVSIPQTASFGFNHTVIADRPAGAAWSTTTDMLKYIQNELDAGIGPNGNRLFAEEPLLERRKPTVKTGANSSYGMGLSNRDISGIEIVQHGGSMAGYLSQIVIIPEANVGAVILTNSDQGRRLLAPFGRKLVELLYDGNSEAVATIEASVESTNAYLAKERAELTIPADPKVVADLALQYHSLELGTIDIRRENGSTILDTGIWSAPLATKSNDDGTMSLIVTEGAARGYVDLIIGITDGNRTLSLLDSQHSYIFTEVN